MSELLLGQAVEQALAAAGVQEMEPAMVEVDKDLARAEEMAVGMAEDKAAQGRESVFLAALSIRPPRPA